MTVIDIAEKQAENQAEKAKKVAKGVIIAGFARAVHPVQISPQACLRDVPRYPNDLRFIRSETEESLRYVKHLGNGVLVPITMEDAASAFACSLGHICVDYGTKDFMEMAKLAKFSAYAYENEARIKVEKLNKDAIEVQYEPLIISETDVVPVRELSEPGWCWKRLDFDADPWGVQGAWMDEVRPRVKTNWFSFCAFIGSLFDPHSTRERYVWLYGGGSSGKSTICEAIMEVFGSAAATRNPAKIKEKWFTASIQGKRLVVLNEASASTINSGFWKSLTGDEYHECENKGEKIFTARADAKFIITSNDYPDIASGKENSRRIILVETEVPDGWVPTDENTKERTKERLREGWPWFLSYCKEAYEQNRRLVPEEMETVEDIQGEDENEEKFHANFWEDKNGTVTFKELQEACGPDWKRWQVRKFINHCIKNHGLIRGRTEGMKFFRGIRKKGGW